jgi:hypothetical protein
MILYGSAENAKKMKRAFYVMTASKDQITRATMFIFITLRCVHKFKFPKAPSIFLTLPIPDVQPVRLEDVVTAEMLMLGAAMDFARNTAECWRILFRQ